ncbi:Uncharacterised protein [Shigella sonnei]|nr:Uncharacterised protein [Shigella sonnei]
MEVYYEQNKKQISFLVGILPLGPQRLFLIRNTVFTFILSRLYIRFIR